MIEEFNALFLSHKTVVMGSMRIEETGMNGTTRRDVYFKDWGNTMGIFPKKWDLLVQNFGGLIDNYIEVELGNSSKGLLGIRARVYWFDFYTLVPFIAKMPVARMIANENNALAADYYMNKSLESDGLIIDNSIDANMKKQVQDMVEFTNKLTWKPSSKPTENKKLK